jgi:hypothetical protein
LRGAACLKQPVLRPRQNGAYDATHARPDQGAGGGLRAGRVGTLDVGLPRTGLILTGAAAFALVAFVYLGRRFIPESREAERVSSDASCVQVVPEREVHLICMSTVIRPSAAGAVSHSQAAAFRQREALAILPERILHQLT